MKIVVIILYFFDKKRNIALMELDYEQDRLWIEKEIWNKFRNIDNIRQIIKIVVERIYDIEVGMRDVAINIEGYRE